MTTLQLRQLLFIVVVASPPILVEVAARIWSANMAPLHIMYLHYQSESVCAAVLTTFPVLRRFYPVWARQVSLRFLLEVLHRFPGFLFRSLTRHPAALGPWSLVRKSILL